MCYKDCYKECLPELYKLLQLYNLVALPSATAKRTFSAMRQIKSWTRVNLTANSLSNKMFVNLHKQRIGNVNLETVASDFIARSERRKSYFGRFI